MASSTHTLVHLHLHTEYSKLDGLCRIPPLVRQAQKYRMGALAVTDHGVMHAIYPLFEEVQAANAKMQSRIDRLQAKAQAASTESERLLWERRAAFVAKHLVKPIAGCEAYLAKDKMEDREKKRYHLVLLAKSKTGYQNLCRITSIAYEKGFFYKPRMDMDLLRKHREGLIVSSACMAGPIAQAILADDYQSGRKRIEEFKGIMGQDFYLEIMLHPYRKRRDSNLPRDNYFKDLYSRQLKVVAGLIRLAYQTQTPLLLTNDVHFLRKSDADLHDFILCISYGTKWQDEDRRTYTHEEYLKPGDQLHSEFMAAYGEVAKYYSEIAKIDHRAQEGTIAQAPDTLTREEYQRLVEEAIANTVRIAESTESYTLKQAPMMPKFDIPTGFKDEREYLRHLVYEGAKQRWGAPLSIEQQERLEFELSTIEKMRFEGYFLIVWDFIREARARGIDVGPGRGSAAGSAIAYALRITNLDPLKYQLLFERFLNPDRNELPDIDVDFDDSRRAEVIEYVREKYGTDCVAGVTAFSRAQAKGAIKDVARVMEWTNQMPAIDTTLKDVKKTAFKDIFKESKPFKDLYTSAQDDLKKLFDLAMRYEGGVRAVSKHACGIIIGSDALYNHAPLFKATEQEKGSGKKEKNEDSESDLLTVQYDGPVMEKIGLIKMDFLGLQTLQILRTAIKLIEKTRGITIDLDSIPLDDQDTLKLFARGETVALFQFESEAMQKYLKRLNPDSFADLIAMNALYRPGPMAYIDTYIDRKHGKSPITYELDEQREILSNTYGITVYQEQVMQLSRRLANFTPGQSDTLRKAMGKKKIKEMEKMKTLFFKGCETNGHPKKKVEQIWKDWEEFSKYAFNKSHSTCYAYLAFQTGYLKAHYPSEYMAANLEVAQNESQKLRLFTQECLRMGIKVLPPDINESSDHISVLPKGDIRYSLSAIKGMPAKAAQSIAHERAAHGPYSDVYDLLRRVSAKELTRPVLQLLADTGALNSITPMANRTVYHMPVGTAQADKPITLLDKLAEFGAKTHDIKRQNSLFDNQTILDTIPRPEIPSIPPPPNLVPILNRERELLGVYLSQHPLDEYRNVLKYHCSCPLEKLDAYARRNPTSAITIGGIVTNTQAKPYTNKKTGKPGTRFVLQMDGFVDSHEFTRFYSNEKQTDKEKEQNALLTKGAAVYLRLAVKQGNSDRMDYNITHVGLLEDLKRQGFRNIEVQIKADQFNDALLQELQSLLPRQSSGASLSFEIDDPTRKRQAHVSTKSFVKLNAETLEKLLDFDLAFKVDGRLMKQNEELDVNLEEPIYDEQMDDFNE